MSNKHNMANVCFNLKQTFAIISNKHHFKLEWIIHDVFTWLSFLLLNVTF